MKMFDLQKVSPIDLGRTLASYLLELKYGNIEPSINNDDYFKYVDMYKIIIGKCKKRNDSSCIIVDGYYVSMDSLMYIEDYKLDETQADHLRIYKNVNEFYEEAKKVSYFIKRSDILKKEITNAYHDIKVPQELPESILHHEILPSKAKYFLLDLDTLDNKYYEMPMKELKDLVERLYEENYARYKALYDEKCKYIGHTYFNNESIFSIKDITKNTCEFKGSIMKFNTNGISYEKDMILDAHLMSDKVYECNESMILDFNEIRKSIQVLFYELLKEYTQLATF